METDSVLRQKIEELEAEIKKLRRENLELEREVELLGQTRQKTARKGRFDDDRD